MNNLIFYKYLCGILSNFENEIYIEIGIRCRASDEYGSTIALFAGIPSARNSHHTAQVRSFQTYPPGNEIMCKIIYKKTYTQTHPPTLTYEFVFSRHQMFHHNHPSYGQRAPIGLFGRTVSFIF